MGLEQTEAGFSYAVTAEADHAGKGIAGAVIMAADVTGKHTRKFNTH